MAEIVNLNKVRKARAKVEAEETAKANRVRFGRTRQEKEVARQQEDKLSRELDGKKLDE